MSNPDLEFSDEDLEDIAMDAYDDYVVVESDVGDERRWGFDRIIIFAAKDDVHSGPFYRFSYYEGSGESEIDFEPTAVERVYKTPSVTHTWKTGDELVADEKPPTMLDLAFSDGMVVHAQVEAGLGLRFKYWVEDDTGDRHLIIKRGLNVSDSTDSPES